MPRLVALLVAILLIVSCGRVEPARQSPLTPTPAAAVSTAQSTAAVSPALPTETFPTVPSLQAAPSTEAGEVFTEPAPPGAFHRLRYLLPADLTGYTIPNPNATQAGATAFEVGLIAPGQEPSPRTTIVLAGGEAAFPEWHMHQGPDSEVTQVVVRNVTGSVHDDGIAFHLLWEEAGNVYTVFWPTGSIDELVTFANGLVAHDPETWQVLANLPTPTPGSTRPTRVKAEVPLVLPRFP